MSGNDSTSGCIRSPANAQGNAYQLVQGLYGMASGGLLGKGLGGGQPYITPLVQSDLVISAFGEELGLAGLMAILLIYGLIVQRGLRTAMSVKDPFSKLLAGGLSFMLALQVFVIVGGVTRLIPLTGITTPFLSQGGSSLVASWMLIALLARLSDTARRPPPRPIQEEGLTQVVTLSEPGAAPDIDRRPGDVRAAADQRQLPAGLRYRQPGQRAGQRPRVRRRSSSTSAATSSPRTA